MEILVKVAELILSLSILVISHEFGHFLAARVFKTRVEKFYLFFDPWFSLFKFKKGDTEYGVGWLPLGGYVKISGMIDESMDKEQMKQPAQPWEFRAKPAWQRLIIMLGGVTVNIILAVLIYIMIAGVFGEKYLPNSEARFGIAVDSLGYELGLRGGDKVLTVNNKPVEDFGSIVPSIILEEAKTVEVERNGIKTEVRVPAGMIKKIINSEKANIVTPRIPMIVDSIPSNSPNINAGFKKNDKIIGVNDSLFGFHDQFKAMAKMNAGKKVDLKVLRGNDTVSLPVSINDKGEVGIFIQADYTKWFNIASHHYNFFQAIPHGFKMTGKKVKEYWQQLGLIFNKDVRGYENVGGFVTMGKIMPYPWDWEAFWKLTAFLSIMLAILNILPIPALDGGHVLFLLVEVVSGRKPSEKFLEYAQIVGMVILFALLIFANGNDIVKLFR